MYSVLSALGESGLLNKIIITLAVIDEIVALVALYHYYICMPKTPSDHLRKTFRSKSKKTSRLDLKC